jgi:hypothetical protein
MGCILFLLMYLAFNTEHVPRQNYDNSCDCPAAFITLFLKGFGAAGEPQ